MEQFKEFEKRIKETKTNVFVYGTLTGLSAVKRFFARHTTLSYSLKRISIGLACLFVGLSIVFLLVRWQTDTDAFLPAVSQKFNWTPEQNQMYLKAKLEPLGLWGSLWDQLWKYWYNIFPLIPKTIPDHVVFNERTGDIISSTYKTYFVYLGISVSKAVGQDYPVNKLFAEGIPYSFAFGIIAVVLSYAISLPLGIYSAMKKQNVSGKVINATTILIYCLPTVIVTLVLFIIPVIGLSESRMFLSGSFWSKFWPELTLVVLFVPVNLIMVRRYFVEESYSEYVRFAMAKGVSENNLYFKHIFRNTSAVILRSLPMEIAGAIFGASLVVETQWGIPGIGNLVANSLSVDSTDPLVIVAYITLSGVTTTFAALFSDLLMVALDPRVKLKGGKHS
ncbi:MAG: ABC transporter permease [Mycoplasmataceae bacterium]|nr:ABC transporter permease [Mycoplasmataceae bacterium]